MRKTITVEAQLTLETCDYCGDRQQIALRIGAREYCPDTANRWPMGWTLNPRNADRLACDVCIKDGTYLEGVSGELPGQWNLKGPGKVIVIALLPLDDKRALLLRDTIPNWWVPASEFDAMSSVYSLVRHGDPVIKFSTQHQQRIVLTFARLIPRDEITRRLGEHVSARMSEQRTNSIEVEWSLIAT